MKASASMMVTVQELGELEVSYNHRLGEVSFWIYHEDGQQYHSTIKVQKFIEFADMVLHMEEL